jgi:inorganic pyrophosphatase
MFYPEEYGFIPNTLDYDGDPLDVICVTNNKTFPGCSIPIRVLGVMEMVDCGEKDDKIIAVNDVDPRLKKIKTIDDLGEEKLREISNFFERYKELEKKSVEVRGFKGKEEAMDTIKKCESMYKEFLKFPSNGEKRRVKIQKFLKNLKDVKK